MTELKLTMATDARTETPPAAHASDDLVARILRQMRAADAEQIEAGRREQAAESAQGKQITLGQALLRLGVITPEALASAEKAQLAQTPDSLDRVGVQVGVYKLLKKLGEGGMGTVFLAEDTASDNKTKVAVKVLFKRHSGNEEFLARFHREAKAASKLKHPNIVSTFAARETDVGIEGGIHYYVMEYCEGEPLENLLARGGALPWQKAVEIILQVARGLQYAHQLGFIHRDIKPANIYMTTDGVARIMDMGLSKNIGASGESYNTIDGQVLGTPHYIAPEQAQGRKDLDGRVDIYSLGATFYHMLTGQTPFEGDSPANVIIKHVTEAVPNPQRIRPEIPDAIVYLLQKMMGKDPTQRHRDCAALVAELEPISRGQLPVSRSAQAAMAAEEGRRRQAEEDARFLEKFRRWAKRAAIVVGVLVVFLIGRAMVRSFFGPSKRDLQNRETISALRQAGEASLKENDLKNALQHFNKIVALAETEDTGDATIRIEVEHARKERERLAAQLAEAEEQARQQKELEARKQDEAQKRLASEQQRKAEEEKKRTETEKAAEEQRKAEEARLAAEQQKTEETRLAAERAAEEKKRKEAEAAAAEKLKQEQARIEKERRKEQNKRRDALRAECVKPAETAVAELSQLERKLSNGATYLQFAEALRDSWANVQAFLNLEEMKTLRDEVNDAEAAKLRASVQAAGEHLFSCQGDWRAKREAGKEGDFDTQGWINKVYGAIEDAKTSLEKFKKMD